MIMESMSCGIPIIAFDIGGNPDMIEHQQNGYLAKPFESEDLARGMGWVLEDEERHKQLSYNARQKVLKSFDFKRIIPKYIELYKDILQINK
jgi:glycosyltransferase involved in cell wall biosynthesis